MVFLILLLLASPASLYFALCLSEDSSLACIRPFGRLPSNIPMVEEH